MQFLKFTVAFPIILNKYWEPVPGDTMISFFFDRIRKNVRSLVGSMSLTTFIAFRVSCWIWVEYWIVDELSIVDLDVLPAC